MPGRLLWTRRLGVTCVALTFLLMVLGAWVKANDAGKACPDWPACYDQWLPPFPSQENGGRWDFDGDGVAEPIWFSQAQVLYEWTHRAVASLVSVPILAFAFIAGREKTFRPSLRRLAWTAVALLAVQGALGALTVSLWNVHWSTTLHLATALVFFTVVLTATCIAYLAPYPPVVPAAARPTPPASPHPAFAPGATAGFVFPGEEPAQPAGEDGHGR